MRTRPRTLLPSVLALTIVSLLVVSAATTARSATTSMQSETARPGSAVELTGAGFPAEQIVEVDLTTPNGTMHMATTASDTNGDFRQSVVLPAGHTEGIWALRATAVDGTSSTLSFTATSAPALTGQEPRTAPPPAAAAEPESIGAAAAPTLDAGTRSGNTPGDIALLLIIAVVLGGVAFGVIYVYQQLKDDAPPGMGQGDDLIWGGSLSDRAA